MLNQLNELNGVESLRSFRGKIGKARNEEAVIFLSEPEFFQQRRKGREGKTGLATKNAKDAKMEWHESQVGAKRFIASRGA